MSRIEKRFRVECDKSPFFSSLVNLGHAVLCQRYSRGAISQAMVQLVDTDDYVPSDEEDIIEHLLKLSHMPNPKSSPDYTALNKDPDLGESLES